MQEQASNHLTLLRSKAVVVSGYGTAMIAYRAVERNVYNRVRRFLVERHKVQSRGIHRFPSERVFGELGVMLPRPIKPAVQRVP